MVRHAKQQVEHELPSLSEELFGSLFKTVEVPAIVSREQRVDVSALVTNGDINPYCEVIETTGETID